MVYRKNPLTLDELRSIAQQRRIGKASLDPAQLSVEQAQHLIEELELHQIEMEMQTEYLEATRVQLEQALLQSNDLFDFAPVGFFSLNPHGDITRLNLAGARLLGQDRISLLGRRLDLFVAEVDQPLFHALLEAASIHDAQRGDISLADQVSRVSLVVTREAVGAGWQVITIDITAQQNLQSQLQLSQARLAMAIESTGHGTWDWQTTADEFTLSKRCAEIFGLTETDFGQHQRDWLALIHPDDRQQVQAALQAHLDGGSLYCECTYRAHYSDGSWRWILQRGATIERSKDGKPARLMGTCIDITDRKATEEALRQASAFQQAVFDSLAAQVAVVDEGGRVLQTNTAWQSHAASIGLQPSPGFQSGNYLDWLAAMAEPGQPTVATVARGIAAVVAGERPEFHLDEPFYSPASTRWFSLKVMPVQDTLQRLVISHEDVTALKNAELANLALVNVDALTGALSRRKFCQLAELELTRATRYALPLMLLMIDLDHFKQVNDSFGHQSGDAVLQGFVQTVRSVLRESDLLGRLGGEEFAVLLPNTDQAGGCALAQRMIDSVRTSPVAANHEAVRYTISIGAAEFTRDTPLPELLAQADSALYRAKAAGRDRLEVAVAAVPSAAT